MASRQDQRRVILLVLAVGLLIRLAFAFRAPVLLQGDSETYLGPALSLERGGELGLALKRTPAYPLFVAGTLAVFGEDLRTVALFQHALGLLTALLACLLGLRIAGRIAGLLAGLATAVAGNLLIYERQIMSEALFALLLTASAFALDRVRAELRWHWCLAAGLAIAAAALVRPVGQALLLLAPLAPLFAGRGWRPVVRCSALTLLGYGLVLGPWSARAMLAGDAASVGSLGQSLVGRTARHDRRDPVTDSGFIYYDPELDAGEEDPTRLTARKILQEAANRGSSGRTIHTRIRKELGLTDAEADRLMRDLAVAAILRRPAYYVSGSWQRFVRLWSTPPERISPSWNDLGTIRRAWEDQPSLALLEQPPGPILRELTRAEALTDVFQPTRYGQLVGIAFSLSLFACLRRTFRAALVPAAAVLFMIGLSAALVGGVSRYRYPCDPLIFVVIAVGLCSLIDLARRRAAGAN